MMYSRFAKPIPSKNTAIIRPGQNNFVQFLQPVQWLPARCYAALLILN